MHTDKGKAKSAEERPSVREKHASYLSINKPITFNNNPISNHTRITMMSSTGAVKYATLNIRPVIE